MVSLERIVRTRLRITTRSDTKRRSAGVGLPTERKLLGSFFSAETRKYRIFTVTDVPTYQLGATDTVHACANNERTIITPRYVIRARLMWRAIIATKTNCRPYRETRRRSYKRETSPQPVRDMRTYNTGPATSNVPPPRLSRVRRDTESPLNSLNTVSQSGIGRQRLRNRTLFSSCRPGRATVPGRSGPADRDNGNNSDGFIRRPSSPRGARTAERFRN